jgi:phosphate transport system permease protein
VTDGVTMSKGYTDAGTTVFGQLIGGRGLVSGLYSGGISVWNLLNRGDQSAYMKIHELPPMKGLIQGFSFSGRDRSFVAWDNAGTVHLYYSTNERLCLSFSGKPGQRYSMSEKGDALVSYGADTEIIRIRNLHPDISIKSLFGKIWYEGHPEPVYSYQSTGASDDFEPKYSLMPLIFGTVKGALFALMFAIPLALTGAIFMNQFMHPNLHRIIKPVVEIMAGLPSVIVGFIGGLWLAPMVEQYLPGILLGLIVTPIVIVFVGNFIETKLYHASDDIYRSEVFILVPFIILAFGASLALTPVLNNIFFAGDFREFFFTKFTVPYDQRNAIVVGFAMGFAVIPVIFSLAEDALSFVPREIIAGSLALGLSRWQTVSGVVLKAARSGIITAVLIGFGRAVGETMIVLMATGNTPVMSPSPFNGFRTLSANIAVELPETAVGSSPYRILFIAALMLFLFTFFINTITDVIRTRLRKRLK